MLVVLIFPSSEDQVITKISALSEWLIRVIQFSTLVYNFNVYIKKKVKHPLIY